MRRANGEGSISQRKDGLWVAQVMIAGKRRSYYGDTRREAVAKMKAARPGRPVALTVSSWLDVYLGQRLEHIRPLTRDSYQMIASRHVEPTLGGIRLGRLTADDVRRFLYDKLATGMSANTVGHLHAFLRAALSEAERDGLVERNVAKLVRPPKWERKEIRPLTADQARRFLTALDGHRDEALYVVALTTGMRQGELLGLTWGDVDLDGGTLRVRLTLQRRHGEDELAPPKTAKSRRTLALPAMAVTALRRHKAQQATERIAAGPDWYDADLVFADALGVPLRGYAVTREFKAILDAAGLPRQRFHDLRHASASFLIASGVPLKVVSEILGHSTITITANTYGHVEPGPLRDAADRLGDALSR